MIMKMVMNVVIMVMVMYSFNILLKIPYLARSGLKTGSAGSLEGGEL